jgi:hypothetical protein
MYSLDRYLIKTQSVLFFMRNILSHLVSLLSILYFNTIIYDTSYFYAIFFIIFCIQYFTIKITFFFEFDDL